jgi:hypothetical protein
MESFTATSTAPSAPVFATVKAITPESLGNLKATINKNFNNLIFRRVSQVFVKKEHLIETVVTRVIPSVPGASISESFPPGTPVSVIYKAGTPRGDPTPKEYDQNVEERYSRFYFFTGDAAMRDNDRHGKISIFGASNKYSQIDIVGAKMDFRFSYENEDRMNLVPPRVGDLVCGITTKDHVGRKNPAYKFWFTCSEQFLHAWTAIRYAEHETLDKLITRPAADFADGIADREPEIRKALFKGNKVCTNSYRKWIRANQECNVPFNQEEAEKRYYSLRCERTAVNWVHVYAALVLILRYREVPNESNVPAILDGGATPKTWDLPVGWINRFVSYYGLVQVDEERKVYNAPVRRRAPREVPVDVTGEGDGLSILVPLGPPKTAAIPIHPKSKANPGRTPVNTPTSPSSFSIKSIPIKASYTKIEFTDELVSLPTKGVRSNTPATPTWPVTSVKTSKIIELDFPPIAGSSPAIKSFMPIGAWANEDEDVDLEIEVEIEEDEMTDDIEVVEEDHDEDVDGTDEKENITIEIL